MRRGLNHNLQIWFLALSVVLAPMQAAVAAIDMLAHDKGQSSHCQTEMAAHADHGDMGHGDCCQPDGGCADNCASCTQCVSVQAMLLNPLQPDQQARQHFISPFYAQASGVTPPGEYRPPRFFS